MAARLDDLIYQIAIPMLSKSGEYRRFYRDLSVRFIVTDRDYHENRWLTTI